MTFALCGENSQSPLDGADKKDYDEGRESALWQKMLGEMQKEDKIR